jgi:hypothetical protein
MESLLQAEISRKNSSNIEGYRVDARREIDAYIATNPEFGLELESWFSALFQENPV